MLKINFFELLQIHLLFVERLVFLNTLVSLSFETSNVSSVISRDNLKRFYNSHRYLNMS